MPDDWHDLPEELQERRPAAVRVYHEVFELTSVEQVEEHLGWAREDLEDFRREAAANIEHASLLVHALQLRLVELRTRREREGGS